MNEFDGYGMPIIPTITAFPQTTGAYLNNYNIPFVLSDTSTPNIVINLFSAYEQSLLDHLDKELTSDELNTIIETVTLFKYTGEWRNRVLYPMESFYTEVNFIKPSYGLGINTSKIEFVETCLIKIVKHKNCSVNNLEKIINTEPKNSVWLAIVDHHHFSNWTLMETISNYAPEVIRAHLLGKTTSPTILQKGLSDPSEMVRIELAVNDWITLEVIEKLLIDPSSKVRRNLVLFNRKISLCHLEILGNDSDSSIRMEAVRHSKATKELIKRIWKAEPENSGFKQVMFEKLVKAKNLELYK